MFGDNESFIKNYTISQSVLKKHHNALSYHHVQEACAAGILNFIHIPGTENVADILTKFLPWSTLKELVGTISFLREKLSRNQVQVLRGVTSLHPCPRYGGVLGWFVYELWSSPR